MSATTNILAEFEIITLDSFERHGDFVPRIEQLSARCGPASV